MQADATRAEALLGLGISLIHTGQPAEALEPLDKYLSLSPDHEQALFGKAVALQQTGRHAEAVEQYRKVLARNPRCEEALSNLVAMFLEKKDNDSVRRYAEMLVELQPDSAVAMEALATLAFADGDYLDRGASLPQPVGSRSRPLRELVQPGGGLSQDGQLREGRAGLPAGRHAQPRLRPGATSTWAWRSRS